MDKHSQLHRARLGLNSLRIASILFLLFAALGIQPGAPVVYADKALVCGIPGGDGPANLTGIVNTYYPGRVDVAAGSTFVPVLNTPFGASAPIVAGDLLLVIQMQGADINSSNTDAYGNGVAGGAASGNLASNLVAGQFEYVVATSAIVNDGVNGLSVNISSALVNSYSQQNYPVGAGNQGQRRFQVIRVPQHSSASLSGTVNALTWNGTVGGVVALDVAGTLNLNGNNINVSGQGFRGGGGVRYTGTTGLLNTDIRTLSSSTLVGANASKGEGIAGTPRFIFNGTSTVDLGVEGYPNGSLARGAPGNAGGGGTDGKPIDNTQNSGGGGGANGGAGGQGGHSWESNLDLGGFGGTAFSASGSTLVLGGGGGSGTANNLNNFLEPAGNVNDPQLSSGGAGGGIVMIRAGTVTGSGTINANGANGQDQPDNESGGGGGAGGSVLVVAQNALPATLNVTANGGTGGDAWLAQTNPGYPGWRHGPGGGGGGGAIFLSSTAGTISRNGGAHGVTTADGDVYGSADGALGVLNTALTPADVPTGISGAECIPTPEVVKTTSTPTLTQTASGVTGEYTIDVSIPAGQGTALSFTISDSLPTGFEYASTVSVTTTGGADRISTANPGAGTSTPAWGTFNIPGGGGVQITFTVNIDASVALGTYQNPATAAYLDPTRTTPSGTTSSDYQNYQTNTGEDITLIGVSLPDLVVTKVDSVNGSVTPPASFDWTITVTNNGPGGAAFTSGQTILSDPLPGAASYYQAGTVTVVNGATAPVGTINCAISATTLSCTASGVVTFAAGASFSINFNVTPTAGGDLVNTVTVDPNGNLTEANEGNNEATSTVSVLAADLSIVKDDGQTSYLGSSTVIYTVTVTNNEGASITGATVSDAKPGNVTDWEWVCFSQTGSAAGCTAAALSTADFTDTVDLPVGGVIVYQVTANVIASPVGNLVNTATIGIPTNYVDTNTNNNTSTDTDTLGTLSADLAITKDDAQTTYSAGGTVTYTVTVQNLSGVTVTNAVVSDPRPANISSWTWVCGAPLNGASGCTGAALSASNFTDTVTLPVGSSIIYTVTANIVASPTGDLVNTAEVTPPPGTFDLDTSNNTSTDTDTLNAADLAVTKDDSRTSYLGGDTIVYAVKVENRSGVTVVGAGVSDPKPANIATWQWDCDPPTGGASGCTPLGSGNTDFTDSVDLPVGGSITYKVTAVVVASPSGDLVNTATVSVPSGFTDSDLTNNTSTDTDVLGPAADLSLKKTVNTTTPAVGGNITFTLTITNIGPDPATGVQVRENLPSGFTYVSSVPSQGTYNNGLGVWDIGNMAVNATETLAIVVTVNLTGSYVNTAQVSASGLIDPDSTVNNDNEEEDDQSTVTVVPNFGNGGGGGGGGGTRTTTPLVTGFLIPVTGFAPNKVTPLNTEMKPAYAGTDLKIEIPTLKVNMPIVGVNFKEGNWDVSWLQDQAGWLAGTAYPTWSGNSVLTAHSVNKDGKAGVFSNLKSLAVGEYVFVYSAGYRYTYKVISNQLVQPTDASVLKHEDKSVLTLVTCDTYDEGSASYLLRNVVRATLVDVSALK